MPVDAIDSVGSEFYLSLDGTDVVVFDCPTGITGLGFTSETRASRCINVAVTAPKPGSRTLSAFTVPFRVVSGSEAHQYVLSLTNPATANVELPFAVGLSDGTADPVLTAGEFGAPGTGPNWTRTVAVGSAYVSAVNVDINDGDDVLGSVTFMPQSLEWIHKPTA